MARGRPKSKLNAAPSEVIEKNFLEQDPDGFQKCEDAQQVQPVVAVNKIPEMRKVIFLNGRDPGVALPFHYSSATHPLKHYTLFHGQEYTLSQEVIDNLEERVKLQYGYRRGSDGQPEQYVKSREYLFTLKPVNR